MWLGTTWEKQEGRFLLGSNSSYALGSTGGNSTIVLTEANMPTHKHQVDTVAATIPEHIHYVVANGTSTTPITATGYLAYYGNDNAWISYQLRQVSSPSTLGKTSSSGESSTGTIAPYTNYMGEGTAFNNMPPYIVVNIWKRLS